MTASRKKQHSELMQAVVHLAHPLKGVSPSGQL
jgi:hypothetical protein